MRISRYINLYLPGLNKARNTATVAKCQTSLKNINPSRIHHIR